jgi:hypothetical protein
MNGGIMKPYGAATLVLAALLLVPVSPLAADSPGGNKNPSPGSGPSAGSATSDTNGSVNPFLPGEQTIGLAAGLQIPAFILPNEGGGVGNLNLGGCFSFSYQYFIARGLGIGGDIAGAFNPTIGGLWLFTAPIGFTTAYWWAKLPFEFSLLGEAGGYLMRYNNYGMIDPFAKAGCGAYWRATPSWSVGLQASFWFVPEIHYGASSGLSAYGGFVETSLAAVYHI